MSIGAAYGYTSNCNFTLISYDFPRWQSYEHNNWTQLDVILGVLVGSNYKGVWTNGANYATNNVLVDTQTNQTYLCVVAHTSPATGTFAQARAANPTYWSLGSFSPKGRGAWIIGVQYSPQDFVLAGKQVAVCQVSHISSASFANDVAAGYWMIVVDLSGFDGSVALSKVNNLSDLTNVPTARANLGLGTAALSSAGSFFATANNLSEGAPTTMRANLGLGTAATQADSSYLKVANNLTDVTNPGNARHSLGINASLDTFVGSADIPTARHNLGVNAVLDAFVGATNLAASRYAMMTAAPITLAVNTTLDPNLSLGADFEFLTTCTATAPTGVFSGWRTGTFHNRGNGSITTATFLGTIAVPAGAYLDGVLNGTRTLAYGQRGYLYYDANTATPTWRWVWIDRTPLLLAGTYTAVSTLDIAFPAGHQTIQVELANFVPSVNNSGLNAQLSANGGSSLRGGSTDYAYVITYTSSSTAVATSTGTVASMPILAAQNTSYATSRAGKGAGSIDTKYGSWTAVSMDVSGAPLYAVQVTSTTQNEAGAAIITPNLLRLFSSGGGAFSINASARGIPSS